MIKKIVSMALAVAMVVSISACAKTTSPNGAEDFSASVINGNAAKELAVQQDYEGSVLIGPLLRMIKRTKTVDPSKSRPNRTKTVRRRTALNP